MAGRSLEYGVTDRELEVLFAVAERGDTAAAAAALEISYQTAKNHLNNLRTRLGCSSTLQAYHFLMGRPRLRVVTTTTVVEEVRT